MELHPKQFKDLCQHETHEYAGTLHDGHQLVDIYFLMDKGANDIGFCIRFNDECPSQYKSGSLRYYTDPIGGYRYQEDAFILRDICMHYEFKSKVLALFFKWADDNKIEINAGQFRYVNIEKSFALIKQELEGA